MRIAIRTFSLGLLFLFASPAFAAETHVGPPPDSAVEKARASFKLGVQLFTEGSYEAALAEFRKAYRLAPSYRVLYNIAQVYYELHDYVNAQKVLKQYTQDGGDEISASRRTQVEEMNKQLEARVAYLEISTNVAGADIRVDDLSVGTSPLSFPIPVNSGPRRVSAVKAGYAVAARTVTVAGAEVAAVALELPEQVSSRSREPRSAVAESNPIVTEHAVSRRGSRTGLVVSLVATATFAVATGIVGWLANGAKHDFDRQLDTFPNSKFQVDNARVRLRNFALATDALGAATVLAGGLSLYFAFTGDDNTGKSSASVRPTIALTPTLGGMLLHGTW